jgi:hypothetical protein
MEHQTTGFQGSSQAQGLLAHEVRSFTLPFFRAARIEAAEGRMDSGRQTTFGQLFGTGLHLSQVKLSDADLLAGDFRLQAAIE